MSTTEEGTVVDGAARAELEAGFRGELIRPGDSSYEERRRIWNGSIDRRPALIARCAGVADVIGAVRFAPGPAWWWLCAVVATAGPACRSATAGW